ncbi:MAG TPA: 50S ribosomal protein L35ae [Pyrodictium sp.]|nr:50S ribosomal protein L35ae [Pyrodictium sp.]
MAEVNVKVYTGVIVGYRRGTNTQYEKQMLIRVDGISSRNEASKLIGWKVAYRSRKGRVFRGKIVRVHGDKGIVIAVFNPPLPGQAIGDNVYIYPKGVILEF